MRRNCSGPLFGLCLWLIIVSTTWTQSSGTWQLGAPMPVRRQELATGALNGSVYVLGGYDENGLSTATVEVYNPVTDTWTFAHVLPFEVNHNAAAVAGGKLYSFGAGAGETFVYDPNSDSWSARASSHYVHSQTAAVGVIDDKIYVAGGTGTPSERELEVYDPVANTWTIKAPMSVSRNHCAGGVIDGQFYVAGGRFGLSQINALEVYDPQTNSWSTRTPMPTARSGIAAAVVNNELWVFGGEEPATIHGEVEVYNPVSNTWHQEADMPLPRHGIWAAVMGNKVYIPGGSSAPGLGATDTNQIFTVGTVPTPTPAPTPTATPTPEACYSNFTTAEGCDALSALTIGAGNTALGWRSLFSDTTGSFNTGVGGGALVLNNADSNTAIGAAALLLNTSGSNNTAVGTDTLVFNDSGEANTATGYFALMNNTTGGSNTAIGSEALTANISGSDNTAIGNLALQSSQTTSNNVVVGQMAGSGITTANNNIIIGHHSGVHSVFGQESEKCYIDNISGAPVSAATAAMVLIDSDGRLGTVTAEGPGAGGSSPKGIRPKAIRDVGYQAMLDLQVQDLEATITQQQQQIDTLTVQFKGQAAQIQKVNTQLEMRKPAANMIVNKP